MEQPQFTLEELMAEKQRRQQMKGQPQQQGQPQQMNVSMPNNLRPQPQQGQDTMLGGLLDKISPGMRSSLYGALASGASGKVVDPNPNQAGGLDMRKLYAQEAIKKQFENDPNSLDTQLKQARIKGINAGLMTDESGDIIKRPPSPKEMSPLDELKYQQEQSKIDEDKGKQQDRIDALKTSAQGSLDNIKHMEDGINYFGPYGEMKSNQDPGTMFGLNHNAYSKRSDWESNVDNFRARKMLDVITEMKSLSRTGATGFGSLSEREGDTLQNASTLLRKDLSPEVARKVMNDLKPIYQKIIDGGQAEEPMQPESTPQLQPGQRLLRNKRTGETKVVNG